jgi:hypothetical protein
MAVALVAAVLFATFTANAAPGVGNSPQTFGLTNTAMLNSTTYTNLVAPFWAAASTNGYGLGTCAGVDVQYNAHGTLVFKGTSVVTNTSAAVTIYLARADSTGTSETTVGGTWSGIFLPFSTGADGTSPITNTFCYMTNIPSSYVGAAGRLNVVKITTGTGTFLYNTNLLTTNSTPIMLGFDEKNCPYPQQ